MRVKYVSQPMGPVQTILTGQRSALGGPLISVVRGSHNQCVALADSGKEQSACVACQASCIDIDLSAIIGGFLGVSVDWLGPGIPIRFDPDVLS